MVLRHRFMNILFLSTRSPYPLISGHSLRTYHILKGAAQKHNVTLVTFVQVPEHELKEENLDHLKSFCKAVYPFRIPVDLSRLKFAAELFMNLFSPKPFVAQKYDVPEVREKIREILKGEKIDLVHVDMLPLTVYINEFKGFPKILVNHNVESMRLYRWFQTESNPVKKAYLGMQYPKLKAFERSAMEKFDCCVVVSEKDKELLRGMGGKNNIAVVPNGTDTSFFKPMGRKTIDNSVLWLGHMDVHTNKDAVLYFWREIFPLLQKQYPQVQMVFVGSAPPKEIADASRKNGNIKVTGFVNDVRPYMDEAAVMVVPLRIGSGTRLKILDAMAMGKAIVSTSVGCEGLRLTDGENMLIADDPKNFVKKVIQLLSERELRQKISENALKLSKEYDWEHIYGIQENIYQEIVFNHNK